MADSTIRSSPVGDPRLAMNSSTTGGLVPLHYRFNGMFTLPEARGKGVAQAIVKNAIEVGLKEAAAKGREYTASSESQAFQSRVHLFCYLRTSEALSVHVRVFLRY